MIVNILTALSKKGNDLGLTLTQMHILMLIEENTGITPSEIAQERGSSSASITPLVKALVKKKLVARLLDAEDLRRFELRVTMKGLDYVNQLREI